MYGYACGSVGQGDVTCHLISLLARAEFIHPDDLEATLGCYVNWYVNRELKPVVSMADVLYPILTAGRSEHETYQCFADGSTPD